jgi:predicted HAD superfamily Cof-like phosphohydrolase
MNPYIKRVKIFHEKFGHPVKSEIGFPDEKTQKLRVDLLQEELNELKEAIADKDIVGVADALADIQYVLSGAVLCFGLQEVFDDVFQEVQNSNMSKLGKDGKPIYRQEDGKILKGENYFKPNLYGVVLGEHKPISDNLDEIEIPVVDFVGAKDMILEMKKVFIVREREILDFDSDSAGGKLLNYKNLIFYANMANYKNFFRYDMKEGITEITFIKNLK